MFTITALNGQLPAAALVVADTGPNGPQQLRTDAAASWERMLAAGLPAGHLRSGYRTRAQQATEVAAAAAGQTPSALPPGQSQHGEGVAADEDEPGRSWLAAHGADYGWIGGLVPGEPWHFQYDPTRDNHQGDDMYSDQDRARDNAIYGWLQGLQPTLATDVPAIKAQIDALNVADTRTRIGNIQYALGLLLARDPQTVTAADIAAAIPDSIAKAVADELASRPITTTIGPAQP